MPGPYAHITLLHELMRHSRLKQIFSASSGFENILTRYFPYCALGAVSPDYPNLARAGAPASQWADAMHYTRACEMIKSGIRRARISAGDIRDKQLTWLLGYCAHVVSDVTIHPIVQAKVGVYAENQRQHRICEMNQDSYIYRRMNLGEVGESDCFALTVSQCNSSCDITLLDCDIVALWEGMLEDVYPDLFTVDSPDIASWHREFITMVTGYSAGAARLFPLAGIIAAKMGLAYPVYETVDRLFIMEQLVPSEKPLYLHYDDIFDHAVCNVAVMWRLVEQAIYAENSEQLPAVGDWNLDTGRDEHDRLVFW